MLKHNLRLSFFTLLCLVPVAGCGDSGGRQAIEGMVTLDGQALADGTISLIPQPGTLSPTAGARIDSGRFSIAAEGGAMAGTFRVEITASRKTGRQVADQFGNPVDEMEQYLPTRYNRQSDLTAELQADRPNELKFELTSLKLHPRF